MKKLLINLHNLLFSVISPGIIAYFAAESVPNFWLKCNGEQKSRTEYANLFAAIGTKYGCGNGSTTFNLPELRGEFIRCWSDGRDGVDTDRAFGSFQWGSSIPLTGYINGSSTRAGSNACQLRWHFAADLFDNGQERDVKPGEIRDGMRFPDDNVQNLMYYIDTPNPGYVTSWSVLKGTRPRNIALLACIKY